MQLSGALLLDGFHCHHSQPIRLFLAASPPFRQKKKPPALALTAFLFLAYFLRIMLPIAFIGVGSDTPQASFDSSGSSLRRCFCFALRSRLFSASVISIHLPRLSLSTSVRHPRSILRLLFASVNNFKSSHDKKTDTSIAVFLAKSLGP